MSNATLTPSSRTTVSSSSSSQSCIISMEKLALQDTPSSWHHDQTEGFKPHRLQDFEFPLRSGETLSVEQAGRVIEEYRTIRIDCPMTRPLEILTQPCQTNDLVKRLVSRVSSEISIISSRIDDWRKLEVPHYLDKREEEYVIPRIESIEGLMTDHYIVASYLTDKCDTVLETMKAQLPSLNSLTVSADMDSESLRIVSDTLATCVNRLKGIMTELALIVAMLEALVMRCEELHKAFQTENARSKHDVKPTPQETAMTTLRVIITRTTPMALEGAAAAACQASNTNAVNGAQWSKFVKEGFSSIWQTISALGVDGPVQTPQVFTDTDLAPIHVAETARKFTQDGLLVTKRLGQSGLSIKFFWDDCVARTSFIAESVTTSHAALVKIQPASSGNRKKTANILKRTGVRLSQMKTRIEAVQQDAATLRSQMYALMAELERWAPLET